jgi:hypothetical protein
MGLQVFVVLREAFRRRRVGLGFRLRRAAFQRLEFASQVFDVFAGGVAFAGVGVLLGGQFVDARLNRPLLVGGLVGNGLRGVGRRLLGASSSSASASTGLATGVSTVGVATDCAISARSVSSLTPYASMVMPPSVTLAMVLSSSKRSGAKEKGPALPML